MSHATPEDLAAALPHITAAPRDAAPIAMLCFRAGYGQRRMVDRLTLTRDLGIPGERWLTAPWLRLPDGRPDPAIQISILPLRVMEAVWRDRSGTVHPGDPIIADLDTSEGNLPVGTRLRAGTAMIEVSSVFNDGCVKWQARYGAAARDWINAPENRPLRLRGILCRIIADGEVTLTDRLTRI